MAFLRKPLSEGSVGLIYSIIQKCIRRGLEEECLYYSMMLYNEATKNSLRKRLVYVTNEDICNLKLAEEIMNCPDEDLFKYVIICCRMKKTHDTAWLSRLALHYSMNNLSTNDEELKLAMKLTEYVKGKDYKSIRDYLGHYKKLYAYSGKNNLVWSSHILYHLRPEMNQRFNINDIDLVTIIPKKFNEIPFWVKDKHVPGGTKGYQFFFDHSIVINVGLYNEDKYAEETKKVYLDDEKKLGNGKTKILYEKWVNDEKTFNNFKDVVQVQLLTRRNNPKVYFATSIIDEKKYVLKGPMKMVMRKQVMKTENLKKVLGLNHLNVEFINLFNQNWMKSDCLLDYDKNCKEIKSSKLEGEVYIYSGINSNVSFDDINESNFMKLFEQYLFRLVTGANDHCARNFIINKINNEIYSVDDHSVEDTIINEYTFNNLKMKKSVKTKWNEYIIMFKQDILNILNGWLVKDSKCTKDTTIKSLIEEINNFKIN